MATMGANGKTLLETTATRVRTASRPPGPTPHQTTPSAGDGFRLNRCISPTPMSSRKRVARVPKRAMASPRIPVKDFGDRLFSLSHPRPDRGSSVFVFAFVAAPSHGAFLFSSFVIPGKLLACKPGSAISTESTIAWEACEGSHCPQKDPAGRQGTGPR